MMNSQRNQQGVALIIVLLIVAIVSVLATEMGGRMQLQVKRASNIKENNQAYWYAMGAEQYARKSLKLLIDNDGDVIHLDQQWDQEFAYPIEGGGIQAQLVDMQSCFNLNALVEPDSPAPSVNNNNSNNNDPLLPARKLAFKRLLDEVEPAIPGYNIDILRDSLVDWLDNDSRTTDYGAEDSEYESLQFPYVAANNFMVHKSELRLVKGVEVPWLNELLKLVCVLPNDSLFKININTVSEENAAVIAAATGLTRSDAESILANRGAEGYQKVEEFLDDPSIQALKLKNAQKDWFDVKTSHFILHTKTKYNDATFAMQTLFKVDSNKKISIIRREFSGF
ncbi:type II secretion system minor pseudopilin GspK [uncultured Paraglaciecola sp.]|uniref:type II secretion system minor pseudopilin GspK n=1 Tax=uncultured Paraglaciecola sp. TaxID=1765024 RepID=UPI00261B1CA1|nr:type II secretion system minor pseudopilin GspK [uncultured Paraglaciecola sp.]